MCSSLCAVTVCRQMIHQSLATGRWMAGVINKQAAPLGGFCWALSVTFCRKWPNEPRNWPRDMTLRTGSDTERWLFWAHEINKWSLGICSSCHHMCGVLCLSEHHCPNASHERVKLYWKCVPFSLFRIHWCMPVLLCTWLNMKFWSSSFIRVGLIYFHPLRGA